MKATRRTDSTKFRLTPLENRVTPALDPTFGSAGKVLFDFGGNTSARAVAVLPDGDLLVGGAGSDSLGLLRLNPDGTLDAAFGTGGKIAVTFGGSVRTGGMAVMADGRVVVVGSTDAGGNEDLAVARFLPTGVPDPTFGVGGKKVLDFGGDERASGVAVRPDGRIVLVGAASGDFGVLRLDTVGAIDPTFGAGGSQKVDFGGDDEPNGVVLQPDGRIVVVGESDPMGGDTTIAVARLTADGLLDSTFDVDGKAAIGYGLVSYAYAAAVRPDGRIVVAGVGTESGEVGMAVLRLNTDGSLDSTFDADGKRIVRAGSTSLALSVAILPDGRVVVGGYSVYAQDFTAARLTETGVLDLTFGGDGIEIVDFGGEDVSGGVAVQSDGRTVLAGVSGDKVAVTRLVDEPLPTISVTGGMVVEGNTGLSTLTFTVTLSAPSVNTVTVTYTTSDGTATAGEDYQPTSGTITFAPGQTEATVAVTIRGDVTVESDETVLLTLVNPFAATPTTTQTAGTIANDDHVVRLLAGGTPDGRAVEFEATAGGTTLATPGTPLDLFPGSGVVARVATADVNGDGVPDRIAVTGPGGGPLVTVLNGKDGSVLTLPFFVFEESFRGGLYVAAGDVDEDGKAEVVVTPDRGGGSVVAVYAGAKLAAGLTGEEAQIVRFFGIDDPNFRGGARPAVGDLNGDGTPDLIVAAGFLGGPRIAIFNGIDVAAGNDAPARLVPDFFAFEESLRNGAFVAAGDVDGDGKADVAFGGGPSGGPRVRLVRRSVLLSEVVPGRTSLDGTDASLTPEQFHQQMRLGDPFVLPVPALADFFTGEAASRGGVRLAMRDIDGDAAADLITGSGEGEASQMRVYQATSLLVSTTPSPDQQLDPFNETLLDGVFVG